MVYAVFMSLYLGTQLSRTLVGNPSRAAIDGCPIKRSTLRKRKGVSPAAGGSNPLRISSEVVSSCATGVCAATRF